MKKRFENQKKKSRERKTDTIPLSQRKKNNSFYFIFPFFLIILVFLLWVVTCDCVRENSLNSDYLLRPVSFRSPLLSFISLIFAQKECEDTQREKEKRKNLIEFPSFFVLCACVIIFI